MPSSRKGLNGVIDHYKTHLFLMGPTPRCLVLKCGSVLEAAAQWERVSYSHLSVLCCWALIMVVLKTWYSVTLLVQTLILRMSFLAKSILQSWEKLDFASTIWMWKWDCGISILGLGQFQYILVDIRGWKVEVIIANSRNYSTVYIIQMS